MGMTVRLDPVLGRVKQCPRCREDWPLDEEFYTRVPSAGPDRWRYYCRACDVEVAQARRDARAVGPH